MGLYFPRTATKPRTAPREGFLHTHAMCVITRRLQALSLSLSLSLRPQDHQTSAPVGRHHTTNPPRLTHSYGLFCLNVLTVEFKNIINRLLNVIGLEGGGGQWSIEGGGACRQNVQHTHKTHPPHTHFRRLALPRIVDHPRVPSSVSAAIGRRCLFCVRLGAAGRASPGARSSCGPPQKRRSH